MGFGGVPFKHPHKFMKHDFAMVIAYAIITTMLFAYMSRSRETVTVNGTRYGVVGVMTYNDKGTELYLPVYKELKK